MSNENQSESKTRHITFGFVIGWIFAVVVGVPGIMMLFEHKVGAGILFILAALVALPPMSSFIKRKAHISLSGGLRVASVIILLIIAGVTLSQGSDTSVAASGSGTTAAAANQPAASAQAPMQVTADTLYSAYNQNQVAADAKYKGNLVEVTGVIGSIGKDILNNPYVTLNTGEYSLPSVQCMFSQADESKLTSLSSGQRITLEGTVSGETLTLVEVDGCTVANMAQ